MMTLMMTHTSAVLKDTLSSHLIHFCPFIFFREEKMMLRSTTLRRLLTQKTTISRKRLLHSSAVLSRDVLDLCDTFPRRHCEYN